MATAIPIQNLYYLFCYAWDRFREGTSADVATTGSTDIGDLLARVLTHGLRRLLRRGLDKGYVEIDEDTASLRGRVLLTDTIRKNLLVHARAACRYDELQYDVLRNQILKATLRRLAECHGLDNSLAQELRRLYRTLETVSDIPLSRLVFHRAQLSRNTAYYDLLLRVCELAYEYLLPEEGGYGSKFPDILKDEIRMSTIFENFVRNFYRLEQRKFKVSRDVIYWDAAADDPSHSTFLPVMLTDVSLRSANNTIIIDTKFYAKALVEYMGGTKVWSTHLYQLYAYLRNLESRPGPDRFAEGVLLYPVVDQILDLRYNIAAHSVRVATIDLNSDWRTIHTRLLGIIGI